MAQCSGAVAFPERCERGANQLRLDATMTTTLPSSPHHPRRILAGAYTTLDNTLCMQR